MDKREEIKIPESLIVDNVQSELWGVIQNYQFPTYLWELIIKNLYLEIKAAHKDRLSKDKADYAFRLQDKEKQEELDK